MIAVIITIMVLELKAPRTADLSGLAAAAPTFLSYVLSFIYVAIYWNNHHHFFQLVPKVSGGILWANMHLLFWLSLIPFATSWLGENHRAAIPTAMYGAALLMPAAAWTLLQATIIRAQGPGSALAKAVGDDAKGKLALLAYAAGIPLAFIAVWLADLCYAAVALLWLVPDRRVEAVLNDAGHDDAEA